MNRRFLMPALIALIFIGAVLVLSFGRPVSNAGQPPLAGAQIGGPFQLVDQAGQPFSDKKLRGHYALIYFGYTYCPDVCPMDMARLMQGLKLFEEASPKRAQKLTPVFITIDPERDTPAVMAGYVKAFHPRLIGLSGDRPAIDQAISAYRIYAKKAGNVDDTEHYLMDHSANGYLFSPDGDPMVLIAQTDTPADIAAALDRWVK